MAPSVRLGRVTIIALIVTLFLIAAIPFCLGTLFMTVLTRTPCTGDVDLAGAGLPVEEVHFPSSEFPGDYAAYFIDGERAGTVIVVPTLGSGRGDLPDAIGVYQRAGFNVLSYRSRVCFGVAHSLGYSEVAAVGDALAYLRSRSDIDSSQIALHGFSAGGATVLMALARYPEVRGAIAHGGYADFDELLRTEVQQLNGLQSLFETGARLGYRLNTGLDVPMLDPLAAISESTQPILLIYGSTEVTLTAAQQMQAAAPDRVRLWVVPGAGHGDYIATAGAAVYAEEVISFLDTLFSAPAPDP